MRIFIVDASKTFCKRACALGPRPQRGAPPGRPQHRGMAPIAGLWLLLPRSQGGCPDCRGTHRRREIAIVCA